MKDEHGTLRYKANPLVRWLTDRMGDSHEHHWMIRREDAPCPTLNSMAVAFAQGAFPLADYMQFYRDMGYSLSCFEEVFGEALDQMEHSAPPTEEKNNTGEKG